MDLLSGIGDADQLTSAREENKVLKAKVSELSAKVKELTLDNATLKAEVEIYRKEAALPSFSKLALGQASSNDETMDSENVTSKEDFVSSGNGAYPTDPVVSLPNITGLSNPLCCAMNVSDNILAAGGADGYITITTWGSALAPHPTAATDTVSKAARIQCGAPAICISFCNTHPIISVGCMDGSVILIGFSLSGGRVTAWLLKKVGDDAACMKHSKYVKAVAWSNSAPVLASASADGTVFLSNVSLSDEDMGDGDEDMGDDTDENESKEVKVEKLKSFHFKNAIETLCFVKNGASLCLYERDTSFLAYFDLEDEFKMKKYSLNGNTTGGFDDFVSFAVMQLSLSPNGKYLLAATDSSRNIIIEVESDKIIRNLYGHKNDCYSQPRVAWSSSGQYVFGNTQENNSIYVWDVASSTMVKELAHHSSLIRDIFSSNVSDTLVTASYDKTCTVWLNAI